MVVFRCSVSKKRFNNDAGNVPAAQEMISNDGGKANAQHTVNVLLQSTASPSDADLVPSSASTALSPTKLAVLQQPATRTVSSVAAAAADNERENQPPQWKGNSYVYFTTLYHTRFMITE